MFSDSAIFSGRIYFSHSQFQVFDAKALAGHHWTKGHYGQAFARGPRSVSFGTPLEFGHANVLSHLGKYEGRDEHLRVIEVPFEVASGEVVVGGPEQFPVTSDRTFQLPVGSYRMTAAQAVIDDENEKIDLYFEKREQPLTKSRIIIADSEMRPPNPLLESAEEPG